MHIAVMTMVRNESAGLPRWVDYYGSQVGPQNLIVIDDRSDDGSTGNLDATVLHLPVRATGRQAHRRTAGASYDPPAFRKTGLANKLAVALLEVFEAVVFTDVDEFIVPDPRLYRDLRDFLEKKPDLDVVAPIGLNLTHVPSREPPLRHDAPMLAQRRFVKFMPNMCKPAIKRVPARWTAGTHGCEASYEIQHDLFLIHTKFADVTQLRAVHQERHREFLSSGAGPKSTWSMSEDELDRAFDSWSALPIDVEPDVLDPRSLPLDIVVRQPNGAYKSGRSSASRSMDVEPLRRLPPYLHDQF